MNGMQKAVLCKGKQLLCRLSGMGIGNDAEIVISRGDNTNRTVVSLVNNAFHRRTEDGGCISSGQMGEICIQRQRPVVIGVRYRKSVIPEHCGRYSGCIRSLHTAIKRKLLSRQKTGDAARQKNRVLGFYCRISA